MTELYFKIEFETEADDVDELGEDLSVFLEEYLNGEQRIDVRYIGHL